MKTTLISKAQNFELIARTALKTEKISEILIDIKLLENKIEEGKKRNQEHEHKTKVLEYEITTLDKKHPDYQDHTNILKESLQETKNNIEVNKNIIKSIENSITEYKEEITKIEKDDIKVCPLRLQSIIEELIEEEAKNQAKA